MDFGNRTELDVLKEARELSNAKREALTEIGVLSTGEDDGKEYREVRQADRELLTLNESLKNKFQLSKDACFAKRPNSTNIESLVDVDDATCAESLLALGDEV